jgi:hypothetical protein
MVIKLYIDEAEDEGSINCTKVASEGHGLL